jgi:predicted HTH transcriptional regulator
MQSTVDLNEADLLARMKNFEDHLVERKTVKDEKDWKKAAVAFANSVPMGLPAVLYIGVRDNGDIETPQANLDEIQKKFNQRMQRVYPRIAYVPKIITENGRQALAVIIPGSELRPHFAGLSFVRKGSESIEASDEQFAELVAQRNSKTARILAWKDKAISVMQHAKQPTGVGFNEIPWPEGTVVVNCDQFCVTLLTSPTGVPMSFPLSAVEINRDNLRRRLQLEVLR